MGEGDEAMYDRCQRLRLRQGRPETTTTSLPTLTIVLGPVLENRKSYK